MTKAPIPTEKSKKLRDNTKRHQKQRWRADLEYQCQQTFSFKRQKTFVIRTGRKYCYSYIESVVLFVFNINLMGNKVMSRSLMLELQLRGECNC